MHDCGADLHDLALSYLVAKEAVINMGYAHEIDWQESVDYDSIGESDFLRETAWVILSCGMREQIVRRKFPDVSAAFMDWQSARLISENRETCRCRALSHFNSHSKIEAIIEVANQVAGSGFANVKMSISDNGIDYLQSFPFIGPVTCYHLAKNIGIPTAKPDRHLERVALRTGYESPQIMCEYIAEVLDESIAVVDLVIWRFATLQKDYIEWFPCKVTSDRSHCCRAEKSSVESVKHIYAPLADSMVTQTPETVASMNACTFSR